MEDEHGRHGDEVQDNHAWGTPVVIPFLLLSSIVTEIWRSDCATRYFVKPAGGPPHVQPHTSSLCFHPFSFFRGNRK